MAAPAPLPHFAATLTRKTTIDIVAIGSSSTFGIGATTADRTYPVQLQGILESTFKGRDFYISNSGTSGEVAAETAKRVRNEVTLKRPDLVLWQVGTNDVLAGVPLEEFRETVLATIRWLKEHQIDVVLIDLQYSPATEKDRATRPSSRPSPRWRRRRTSCWSAATTRCASWRSRMGRPRLGRRPPPERPRLPLHGRARRARGDRRRILAGPERRAQDRGGRTHAAALSAAAPPVPVRKRGSRRRLRTAAREA